MSFQKVRDELIYCFANGILDEEEFVLLYDAYKSIESQRRKLFQLLESCWSCWPGYLIGKGLVSRNNMAAAKAILQELYFRGIDPLKYVLSHRYGWRFCSSVSSNGNRLQGDTREETEGESPAGKMLALVVSSLRVDRVLSSGLGMGRSKAGDLIAARHLYLNQKICQKASLQVNEGDEIDITKSKENSVVELSRFKVLTIDKNHTKKNKRRLSGVRFARIFMPREEFDKKYKSSD